MKVAFYELHDSPSPWSSQSNATDLIKITPYLSSSSFQCSHQVREMSTDSSLPDPDHHRAHWSYPKASALGPQKATYHHPRATHSPPAQSPHNTSTTLNTTSDPIWWFPNVPGQSPAPGLNLLSRALLASQSLPTTGAFLSRTSAKLSPFSLSKHCEFVSTLLLHWTWMAVSPATQNFYELSPPQTDPGWHGLRWPLRCSLLHRPGLQTRTIPLESVLFFCLTSGKRISISTWWFLAYSPKKEYMLNKLVEW